MRGKRKANLKIIDGMEDRSARDAKLLAGIVFAGEYYDPEILSEYKDLLGISKEDISRQVLNLEQRGYLKRLKENKIALTAQGKSVLKNYQPAPPTLISGLDASQAAYLLRPLAEYPLKVASQEDVMAMVELKREIVKEIYGPLGAEKLKEWMGRFVTPRYFAERIGEEAVFFVAGDPQDPIAIAALKKRDGKAYLGDLYCRVRHQGMGSLLERRCIELAKAWGLKEGVCDVFSTNQLALTFVQKQGWEQKSEYEEQSFKIPVYRFSKSF